MGLNTNAVLLNASECKCPHPMKIMMQPQQSEAQMGTIEHGGETEPNTRLNTTTTMIGVSRESCGAATGLRPQTLKLPQQENCNHRDHSLTSSERGSAAAAASASASGQTSPSHYHRQLQQQQQQQQHQISMDQTTTYIFGKLLTVWRRKARCGVVSTERAQELFQELNFYPSDKQINEILQMAKVMARKGNRQGNDGLTFGEFCVLAADLRKFRNSGFLSIHQTHMTNDDITTTTTTYSNKSKSNDEQRAEESLNNLQKKCTKIEENTMKIPTNVENTSKVVPVEVFLGGSCNPTTWRADVAIPTLEKLGISFYNPQVSDWTPDLIELEHRAKEKARVLFFVMDSETRGTAGAIEAAHIAGQNSKQLVLVLHPYQRGQSVLNEPISEQEYNDLTDNQRILYEVVKRSGQPVLDNIPSGLQRIKELLSGRRDPPSNIASSLIIVRGAFDRVNEIKSDYITLEQCQRALWYLGYARNLINFYNLNKIIDAQEESLTLKPSTETTVDDQRVYNIDFNQFCVITAYFTLLQHEIHESGCISPIKGINVPPPPIYFTNMHGEERCALQLMGKSAPASTTTTTTITDYSDLHPNQVILSKSLQEHLNRIHESENDLSKYNVEELTLESASGLLEGCRLKATNRLSMDLRDVYLGGSCYLRTMWRQKLAIPYLKTKGISFHLPTLRETMVEEVKMEKDTGLETTLEKRIYDPVLLESSRILLFVITDETRSLAPMTLAAHCIGLMYNVVLVVQMLQDNCIIGNEKLTNTAIKDYNRGRMYLIDLAKRQGIPVFSEITAALQFVADELKTKTL